MRPLPLRRRALLRAGVFAIAFTVPVAVLAYVVRAQVEDVLRLDRQAIVAATTFTRAHPALAAGAGRVAGGSSRRSG